MAGAILNFCIRQCKGHIRDDMTVLVTGIWKKGTDAFFFAGFRYIKDMIGKIMDYIKEYEMIQEMMWSSQEFQEAQILSASFCAA